MCIYSENLKVLPVVIQKLLGFDKLHFLTFDLYPVDRHIPKVVRHKFTLRFIIPEKFKSLASVV